MEYSEGLGRSAEVWVDGTLLTVCDSVSTASCRCPPGPLEGVGFKITRDESLDWNDAILANSENKILLEPVSGCSYLGYGKVQSVMPVVIDFGLVVLTDPQWSTDEGMVGMFVQVPISRLEIVHEEELDYPQ